MGLIFCSGRYCSLLLHKSSIGVRLLTKKFAIILLQILTERGMCIKGQIWPSFSQKLKVAFHENHPIGLLEE